MSADSTTPALGEVIRSAIRSALLEVHVSMPARVEAFDPEHQRCDVQPLLRRTVYLPDGTTEEQALPRLSQVPIAYTRAAGYRVTWPLAVGDIVRLVFAERSLDAWLAGDGGLATPNDGRHHDLGDAIVDPGISPFGSAIPGIGATDLIIGREDGSGEIRLKPDGSIRFGSSEGLAPGVARLGDRTIVDGTTDAAMVAWMAAVHAAIVALGGAVPTGGAVIAATFQTAAANPPSNITGKIDQASTKVSST